MPIEIALPVVSPGMESAKLVRWLFTEGQTVSAGDELVEIETDKATLTIESPNDGKIGSILVPNGTDNIKVGTPIAFLLSDGEGASAIAHLVNAPAAEATISVPTGSAAASGTSETTRSDRRIFASPLARRIAKDADIDLGTISGSGPRGRILKTDVLASRDSQSRQFHPLDNTAQGNSCTPSPFAPARTPILGRSMDVDAIYSDRPHTALAVDGMRRTVAERLSFSKQSVPHYYLRGHVVADHFLSLRADINARLQPQGIKLSINDFIVKACGLALQQVPECNAVWAGNKILRLDRSDIAVAIAVENGLYTPVLRDVQTTSLSAISTSIREYSVRARERTLTARDYDGGSMTVSNLGMFGVESFDAIINPPQATILAIGACVTTMIDADDSGEMRPAKTIAMSLSIDHRVVDGAQGAAFLSSIRNYLENPMTMLV